MIFYSNTTITTASYAHNNHSKNTVMSIDKFIKAINENNFLKSEHQTTYDRPLNRSEIVMIKAALQYEHSSFGGVFNQNRNINYFTGDTLVVGGGKKIGKYGTNQGMTVLTNINVVEAEIEELIKNLQSGKWNEDPYIGKHFTSITTKKLYIKQLLAKKNLYKEAFSKKNQDTLNRYYTVNIDVSVDPDLLGSITSKSDMSKIPDNKFTNVEFENVPCNVFLDPKLYPIIARITKSNGKISFSVSNACSRLIVPVIQSTKFGKEFMRKLKKRYNTLKKMHPTYHRINIKVVN